MNDLGLQQMDALNNMSEEQILGIRKLVDRRFSAFVNQKDFTQRHLIDFKKSLRSKIQTEFTSDGRDLHKQRNVDLFLKSIDKSPRGASPSGGSESGGHKKLTINRNIFLP